MESMNHRASTGVFSAVLLLAITTVSQATTIRLDTTRAYLKAGQLAAKPGDTVCIEPGRRKLQYIQGIHGTTQAPILVTNCPGGKVLIGTTHYYGLFFDSVSHIRVTGGLDPAIPYGIHVDGTASGSGVSVTGMSHHVEIDHLEISGTNFAGIMVKQDYDGNPPSPLPLFPGLSIHHNYIHHTGGEGMYLGETKSPGQMFSEVEVHHNVVIHTGWDIIQTSNMDGVRVHHNVMIDGGVKNELYQANGYQVGNNVRNLRFDHNIVIGTNENSINCLGGGKTLIDSNWLEAAHGPQSLFIENHSFADTGDTIEIRDNYWKKPVRLVWKNYDEVNKVVFANNRLEPYDTLIYYASGAGTKTTTITGTGIQSMASLMFEDSANGDWRLSRYSTLSHWDLGIGTVGSVSSVRGEPRTDFVRGGRKARTYGVAKLPVSIVEPRGRKQ
jgi:hypothetical protein